MAQQCRTAGSGHYWYNLCNCLDFLTGQPAQSFCLYLAENKKGFDFSCSRECKEPSPTQGRWRMDQLNQKQLAGPWVSNTAKPTEHQKRLTIFANSLAVQSVSRQCKFLWKSTELHRPGSTGQCRLNALVASAIFIRLGKWDNSLVCAVVQRLYKLYLFSWIKPKYPVYLHGMGFDLVQHFPRLLLLYSRVKDLIRPCRQGGNLFYTICRPHTHLTHPSKVRPTWKQEGIASIVTELSGGNFSFLQYSHNCQPPTLHCSYFRRNHAM